MYSTIFFSVRPKFENILCALEKFLSQFYFFRIELLWRVLRISGDAYLHYAPHLRLHNLAIRKLNFQASLQCQYEYVTIARNKTPIFQR